ncbi:MAG: hypothetical protein ACRCS7_00150, partial [Tannerellaceae bacterium]
KDIGTERQIQFSIQTIPLPYSIPFLRDNNYITTYDDYKHTKRELSDADLTILSSCVLFVLVGIKHQKQKGN